MGVAVLPQTTVTYYLQADGTYTDAPLGNDTEVPVLIAVTDGLCTDDLDPNGNETTSDLQGLAQDVYHLLLEAPGSNIDDPDRGVGLEGYLSKSTADLGTLASIIDGQLRRDTRIDSSRTTVTANADGSYTIAIDIVANGALLPLGYLYSSAAGLVPSS